MIGIIEIDMHIRDQRILDYIRHEMDISGGVAFISHRDIAEKFGCHRNTSRRIIKRLAGAGHFRVACPAKKSGHVYTAV